MVVGRRGLDGRCPSWKRGLLDQSDVMMKMFEDLMFR